MAAATETFRRQHTELYQLALELGEALGNGPTDLHAEAALHAMARLAGKLRIHAAMEDEALYPRLLAHDDAAVRDKAQTFSRLFGDAYRSFLEFRKKWTAELVAHAPAEFHRGARGVISLLAERVTHENDDLYAMVDALYPAG